MSVVIKHGSPAFETLGEDLNYQRYLSPFQIEKFTFMFNTFFDSDNSDGFIQKGDVVALLEKIRRYRGLLESDPKFVRMCDVMYAFYDCLTEQVLRETSQSEFAKGFDTWEEALKPRELNADNISLNQWLNMWGKLCRGAAGISGFPIWVQLLGILFFETIDQDEDGFCNEAEIKKFYEGVVGIDPAKLDKTASTGYKILTANNTYILNRDNFLFCFANFLLGRDIYGPGKYIFGVFDNRDMEEAYKVKYNEED